MTFAQPLDLYSWFVTTFAGNLGIFTAIAFVLIASLSAMFRMPNIIVFMSFGLFVIMLSVYMQSIALIVLIIAGLAIGWWLSRIWK